MKTYIYFISMGETGSIKIGWSDDPLDRMNDLQTASPKKLILLGVMFERKEMETQLHNKFEHIRQEGEWFDRSKELLDYIKLNSKMPGDAFEAAWNRCICYTPTHPHKNDLCEMETSHYIDARNRALTQFRIGLMEASLVNNDHVWNDWCRGFIKSNFTVAKRSYTELTQKQKKSTKELWNRYVKYGKQNHQNKKEIQMEQTTMEVTPKAEATTVVDADTKKTKTPKKVVAKHIIEDLDKKISELVKKFHGRNYIKHHLAQSLKGLDGYEFVDEKYIGTRVCARYLDLPPHGSEYDAICAAKVEQYLLKRVEEITKSVSLPKEATKVVVEAVQAVQTQESTGRTAEYKFTPKHKDTIIGSLFKAEVPAEERMQIINILQIL